MALAVVAARGLSARILSARILSAIVVAGYPAAFDDELLRGLFEAIVDTSKGGRAGDADGAADGGQPGHSGQPDHKPA
ncbi:hypothetical protein [Micromonospora sp. B9E7]|uniref:hypothetical protein n=1 Tax=Micromonospora sp. B9E7 TaxID=3153574 RepID=UPI00325E1ADE